MRLTIPDQSTWDEFKRRMNELDWSEQELATRAGVPQPTVHRIINGRSKSPRTENVLRIAAALNMNHLAEHGVREPSLPYGDTNTVRGPSVQGRVPLISWVQAGDMCDAIDLFAPGTADEWLECPFPHSSRSFCLRVVGLSMFPEYRENEIILVDPDVEARHGDDVVVRTPEGKTTFKRLHATEEGTYLVALNPDLQGRIIQVPEDTMFCGVVTGSWTDRRRS